MKRGFARSRSTRQRLGPAFRPSCLSSPSAVCSRLVARVRCGVRGQRHSPSWGCWGLRPGGSVPSAVAPFQGLRWRECRGGHAGAHGAVGEEPGRRGGPQPAAGGAHGLPADPAALQKGETVRTGAKRALAGNPSSSSLSFPPREPQSRSSVSPWAWSPRAFLGHCTLRGSVPLTRAVNLLGCSGQVSPRVAGAVCAQPGPPVPKTSVSGCVPRWTDIKPPVTGGPPSGLPFPPVPPPHHRSEHLLGARCVPGTTPSSWLPSAGRKGVCVVAWGCPAGGCVAGGRGPGLGALCTLGPGRWQRSRPCRGPLSSFVRQRSWRHRGVEKYCRGPRGV